MALPGAVTKGMPRELSDETNQLYLADFMRHRADLEWASARHRGCSRAIFCSAGI